MDKIVFRPIGIIHTPFKQIEGMPIQPSGASDVPGSVQISLEYQEALDDVVGFSHLILLYHFHRAEGFALKVKPFMDDHARGMFATRAPRRPNPIGLSVVRLVDVKGCTLDIQGVDMLDGTPLLDLKPFVPQFDAPEAGRIGWLTGRAERSSHVRADGRFGAEIKGAD